MQFWRVNGVEVHGNHQPSSRASRCTARGPTTPVAWPWVQRLPEREGAEPRCRKLLTGPLPSPRCDRRSSSSPARPPASRVRSPRWSAPRVGGRGAPGARRGLDRHAGRRDGPRRGTAVGLRPAPQQWRRRPRGPASSRSPRRSRRETCCGERQGRRGAVASTGPWSGHDVAFVWQRHEMFHTGGIALARTLDVPSVLFVTAPQVWEAEQWGVRRPGWGRMLERAGERPALHAADLVACGTATVAEQVVRLGVGAERDPDHADRRRPRSLHHRGGPGAAPPEARSRRAVRRRMGRQLPEVPRARRPHRRHRARRGRSLLFVGDGPNVHASSARALDRGVHAVFAGTTPHAELPRHLAAMDCAVVLASARESVPLLPAQAGRVPRRGAARRRARLGPAPRATHGRRRRRARPARRPAGAQLPRWSGSATIRGCGTGSAGPPAPRRRPSGPGTARSSGSRPAAVMRPISDTPSRLRTRASARSVAARAAANPSERTATGRW